MPPEHETLTSALCCIMYGAKNARRVDEARAREWLLSCRKVLLHETRRIGKRGRERVGLRVWHGVDRILHVTNPKRLRRAYDGNWSSIWYMSVEQVSDACDVALRNPKLGLMRPSTWAEQIAGRATLMAKAMWPELMEA